MSTLLSFLLLGMRMGCGHLSADASPVLPPAWVGIIENLEKTPLALEKALRGQCSGLDLESGAVTRWVGRPRALAPRAASSQGSFLHASPVSGSSPRPTCLWRGDCPAWCLPSQYCRRPGCAPASPSPSTRVSFASVPPLRGELPLPSSTSTQLPHLSAPTIPVQCDGSGHRADPTG